MFSAHWRLCLTLSLLMGLSAGPARAYEEAAVVDGGTITGSVTFAGPEQAPKLFELRRSPDRAYCGALSDGSGYRPLREAAVSVEGGLQDVVVTVEEVRQGKPFALQETRLEANVCQFIPFVSVVRDRHPLTVTNLDPVAHDLQIYERDREHVFIIFHRPSLTRTGTTDRIKLTGARREMTMQCGMHPFMQAHGRAVENPYYAVTGRDGTFVIGDVPNGTYRVTAWHPMLGEQQQEIVVPAKGTAAHRFTFHNK